MKILISILFLNLIHPITGLAEDHQLIEVTGFEIQRDSISCAWQPMRLEDSNNDGTFEYTAITGLTSGLNELSGGDILYPNAFSAAVPSLTPSQRNDSHYHNSFVTLDWGRPYLSMDDAQEKWKAALRERGTTPPAQWDDATRDQYQILVDQWAQAKDLLGEQGFNNYYYNWYRPAITQFNNCRRNIETVIADRNKVLAINTQTGETSVRDFTSPLNDPRTNQSVPLDGIPELHSGDPISR